MRLIWRPRDTPPAAQRRAPPRWNNDGMTSMYANSGYVQQALDEAARMGEPYTITVNPRTLQVTVALVREAQAEPVQRATALGQRDAEVGTNHPLSQGTASAVGATDVIIRQAMASAAASSPTSVLDNTTAWNAAVDQVIDRTVLNDADADYVVRGRQP